VISNTKLNRTPYFITNMGLSIELKMIPLAMETYFAALDCEVENLAVSRIGIFLRLLPGERQYARVRLDDGDIGAFGSTFRRECVYVSIYVRQNVWNIDPTDLVYGFWLRTLSSNLSGFGGLHSISPPEAFPRDHWDAAKRIFRIPVGSGSTAGRLNYDVESLSPNSTFDLKFGFNRDFWPVISLLRSGEKLWEQSIPLRLGSKNGFVDRSDANYKAASKFLREDFIQVTAEVIDGQKMWVVDVERLPDDSS
jgi:hypothetical protein